MTLGTKLQRPSQPREWPIAVLDFTEASQSSGQEEQKGPRSGAKSIKVEKGAHRRFLSELYYESSCLFNWIDLFEMQNLSQFLSLQFHFYSSCSVIVNDVAVSRQDEISWCLLISDKDQGHLTDSGVTPFSGEAPLKS